MLGGVGTIALVIVMRVLVVRQWRAGVGLNPKRRFLLPLIALAIGIPGIRRAGADAFDAHVVTSIVVGLAATAVAGVVRAVSCRRGSVAATELYPGGVAIRATTATVIADVAGVLVAGALILPALASAAGLHPAAGAWALAVAIGDIVASGLLMLRYR